MMHENNKKIAPTMGSGSGRLEPTLATRSVWIVLIVASGACLSPFFACVTPFAALATLAALKLSRSDAMLAVGLMWVTNQAVGYGILGYPWTWDSVEWGLAIGVSAGVAVLAAATLSTTRPAPLAVSLPFVAAFAAFESGLYLAGLVLPGSEGTFSASIVGHVFLINALSLVGLVAMRHLAAMSGILSESNKVKLTNLPGASFQ